MLVIKAYYLAFYTAIMEEHYKTAKRHPERVTNALTTSAPSLANRNSSVVDDLTKTVETLESRRPGPGGKRLLKTTGSEPVQKKRKTAKARISLPRYKKDCKGGKKGEVSEHVKV
jgi:hypothetical protein